MYVPAFAITSGGMIALSSYRVFVSDLRYLRKRGCLVSVGISIKPKARTLDKMGLD
jgi:hypothetical protein